MTEKIEITLRPGSEFNMLNFHVPQALRERLIAGIAAGHFELPTSSINFEMSVLPSWIADPEQREESERKGSTVHVRVPLKALNVHFSDEE